MGRSKFNGGSSKFVDFTLRFRVKENSPDAQMLDYLKSEQFCNDLALRALRGYWWAVACEHKNLKKGQALKDIAYRAAQSLLAQIEFLQATYGFSLLSPVLNQYALGGSRVGNSLNLESALLQQEKEQSDKEEDDKDVFDKALQQGFDTAGL